MEVVNHQTESGNSSGRLSLNDKSFDREMTSPRSNNDNEDTLENRISSKLMTNKFKRIFPPGINDVTNNDSTSNSSPDLSGKGSTESTSPPVNNKTQAGNVSKNKNSLIPSSTLIEDPCEIVSSSSDDVPDSHDQPNNSTTPEESAQSNQRDIDVLSIDSNGDDGSKDSSSPQENGSRELKIQMVTSLNDSEIFVEAPSGPLSPAVSVSNPLESDKEETRDSVITFAEKDKELAEKSSTSTSDSSSKGGEALADKDGEQDEVITGDKTINLNTSGDKDDSDKSIVTSQSNKKDGVSKIKVIYPKKKPIDVGQIKITKAPTPLRKNCLQCSKLTNCDILIEISGSECFLCSEECLKLHKTDQINALQRKNCAVIPSQEDLGAESRICVNCDANVTLLPEDKILSWETMEFCNEDCLSKYQTKMWSFCTACKKDVPTSSMGKYCVRFGHEVKQFCSGGCLEEFKKGIKVCCYCQKDLSANEEGFLAPIGERGQFKDFCSQTCLDEYYCMSHNIPGGLLKVEPCGVCDKTTLIQVQVITSPETTVNLCSMVCLAAFKFVNTTVSPVPCYMCKKYYLKTIPNAITVFYESELLTFCSKSCMNINILAKRRIVACNWCKVKKYNFDMIRRKASGTVTNWCSVNCMALYQVSVSVSNNKSRMPCTYCKKLEVPHLHLTMSDATVRNFCSMECVNAFQTSFPAGGQTNGIQHTPSAVTEPPLPALQPIAVSNLQKKTGEIKVISPAAVNGAIQAALVAPGPQPRSIAPQPTQQQIIKHQILVVPQSKPKMTNAKVQVRPCTFSRAVTVKVNRNNRSSQTSEEEEDVKGPVLVPIPVPIYIPCPMAMYSVPVPTPIPIPIPVPVPIIIPTTKGTAEEILADIKRIQEQMPGNPYEAELLLMAQMVEGKKPPREEGDSSQDEKRERQKRPADDMLHDEDGPPEKKRKEGTEVNALGSTVHHLAVSRLSMSLKETLGVSAWKNYAALSGEDTDLLEMRPAALAQALKGFILNAKIPGGGNYTPDQKYYLMLGIQYYLQENGRVDNIFYDLLMEPFIKALDEESKVFQNSFTENDNIITRVEEEHLWESKQLGPQNPSSLLATLIYFNMKYFNLMTVEEHMQLSFKDFANHWKINSDAVPSPSNAAVNVLKFVTPDSILESNPKKKKVYEQEANTENSYRCPVQLYEFYLSKCPRSVKTSNNLFYLKPESSFLADSPTWYSAFPLPEEDIVRTLNRFKMVKEINIALLSS